MAQRVTLGGWLCVVILGFVACGKELPSGTGGSGGSGGSTSSNPTTSNMTNSGGAGAATVSSTTSTTSGLGPCVLDQSNLDDCLLQ